MGLFTGLIRLNTLKQRQLDLEYKVQTLAQTQSQISAQASELVTIGNDLDPESPEFKLLEQRRRKLHMMEKRMEAELLRYRNMLKMVDAELQSAQKIVDKSIKRLFSY